jgi:integrase
LLAKGIDPLDQRDAVKAEAEAAASRAITFRTYAETWIDSREAGWKNAKHRQQWRNTLATYAYPIIGELPVCEVDTEAVKSILVPIWKVKPETANRVRGRIEKILNAAKADKLRTGENPAIWRGHLDQFFPPKKKVRKVRNHPALPYDEAPAFWRSLRADMSEASKTLQFIILTAARYNEAAGAHATEINSDKRLWTVPEIRMKGDRQHEVPLVDQAMALVDGAEGLLFRSSITGKPISGTALAKCIARHTSSPATTHGFRSTFRDWAGDCTEFPETLAEFALAHKLDDETEAAYRRATALAKRRKLMEAWASYLQDEATAAAPSERSQSG